MNKKIRKTIKSIVMIPTVTLVYLLGALGFPYVLVEAIIHIWKSDEDKYSSDLQSWANRKRRGRSEGDRGKYE